MMKVRIAIGFGLVLFMATMIGGPVKVSQAQDDGGVTLASLAGKFSARGGGFQTTCVNATMTAPAACASVPEAQRVLNNLLNIAHFTRDAAGNACFVFTGMVRRALAPASAATSAFTTTVLPPIPRLIRRPGRVLPALATIVEGAASGRPSIAQAQR